MLQPADVYRKVTWHHMKALTEQASRGGLRPKLYLLSLRYCWELPLELWFSGGLFHCSRGMPRLL
jgi:hypothetical protein